MAEAAIKARIAADGQQFLTTLKNLEAATAAWSARTTQVVTTQAAKTAKTSERTATAGGKYKAAGWQNALLDTSRAIEDVQYGLQGVLNNLPGIATALGAGAGLTGVISITAVALYQLTKGFISFITNSKRIKEVTDEVGRLDAKLKVLGEKGAKEALEGTAEAATQSKDALSQMNDEVRKGNTELDHRLAIASELAKGQQTVTSGAEDTTGANVIAQEKLTEQIRIRTEALAELDATAQELGKREREAAAKLATLQEGQKQRDEEAAVRLDTHLKAVQAQMNIEAAAQMQRIPEPEDIAAVAKARHLGAPETEEESKRRRYDATMAANEAKAAVVDAGKMRKTVAEEVQRVEEENSRAREQKMVLESQRIKDLSDDESERDKLRRMANEDIFMEEMKVAEERQKEVEKQNAIEQKQATKLSDLVDKERQRLAVLQQITREHKEALGDLQKEARIKGLREQGRDTQADREERAMKVQQRARQIHDLGQTTPSQSMQLAMQLEGSGRGRVSRSTGRHRQAGGIDDVTEIPRQQSTAEQRRMERHLERMERHLSGKRDDRGDPVPREH